MFPKGRGNRHADILECVFSGEFDGAAGADARFLRRRRLAQRARVALLFSVSANGRVAVGCEMARPTARKHAVGRLRRAYVGIGDLPGGTMAASHRGVSFDGSIIVGAGTLRFGNGGVPLAAQ